MPAPIELYYNSSVKDHQYKMNFIDSFWIDAGTARFYAKHSLKYVPSPNTRTMHTKHCSTNSFMNLNFVGTSVPLSPICVGMLEIRNKKL